MTETNTTRPTFDQYLAEWFDDDSIDLFKSEVAELGYVIVHPDDVPTASDRGVVRNKWYQLGWDACRAHIFGDATQ